MALSEQHWAPSAEIYYGPGSLWTTYPAPASGPAPAGHSLPLDGRSSEFVVVLERRGVGPGCSSEACSSRPCRGPLYCVDLWRKHECR